MLGTSRGNLSPTFPLPIVTNGGERNLGTRALRSATLPSRPEAQSLLGTDQFAPAKDHNFPKSYDLDTLFHIKRSFPLLNKKLPLEDSLQLEKHQRIKKGTVTAVDATAAEIRLILHYPIELINPKFIKEEYDRIKFWKKSLSESPGKNLQEEQDKIVTKENLKRIDSQTERKNLIILALSASSPRIQSKADLWITRELTPEIISKTEDRIFLRSLLLRRAPIERQRELMTEEYLESITGETAGNERTELIYQGLFNDLSKEIQAEAIRLFTQKLNSLQTNETERTHFRMKVVDNLPLDVLRAITMKKNTLEQILEKERSPFIHSLLNRSYRNQGEFKILQEIQKAAASWITSESIPRYRERSKLRKAFREGDYYRDQRFLARCQLSLQLAFQ